MGVGALVQLGCLALIVVAGDVVAGEAAVDDQRAWLVVAIAAVAVSGVVNGTGLIGARRAVGRRRAELLRHLDDAELPVPAVAPTPPDGALVAVPGLALVHRPDCPLVAGKRTAAAGAGDGTPCGWCRP